MKNKVIDKKLTKHGDIKKLKINPQSKEKYNTLTYFEKCEFCGNYYNPGFGCLCEYQAN